ncbi:MAG: protein translocase subunit SecD [Patescibacteria group bacterium]|nr:protein translocase subunit SecD [Patescibacteria group bacterium]
MTPKGKHTLSFIGIIVISILLLLVDLGSQVFGSSAGLFSKKINLGLDLQGGTQLTYRVDLSEVLPDQKGQILDGVKSVIENRVNSLGVAEPNVYTAEAGSSQLLVVELPGVKDQATALAKIGKVVNLEFMEEKRLYSDEELSKIQEKNKETMATASSVLKQVLNNPDKFNELQKLNSVSTAEAKTRSESVLSEAVRDALSELKPGEVNASIFPAEDRRLILKLEKVEDRQVEAAQAGVGVTAESSSGAKADVQATPVTKTEKFYTYREIAFDLLPEVPHGGWAKTGLTGAQFEFADVSFDDMGRPIISISFNKEGGAMFKEITERNLQKPIAIFIDGYPADLSTNKKVNEQNASGCSYELVQADDGNSYCPYAPIVQSAIADGKAVITGKFTQQEAHNIARNLNTGAIPAPVMLIGQQSVGASLGTEALRTGIKAGLYGLIAVALFMVIYYRFSGWFAVVALIIYTITVLAIFKIFGITLTLAGVAGFILSIGMAVDANILIFERMKEEFRLGKNFRDALHEGFSRAWSSIRDSNCSSLITCAILFIFGSGSVRGFAVTLAIGILVSMVTAVTVTRTIMEVFADTKLSEKKNLWVRVGKIQD